MLFCLSCQHSSYACCILYLTHWILVYLSKLGTRRSTFGQQQLVLLTDLSVVVTDFPILSLQREREEEGEEEREGKREEDEEGERGGRYNADYNESRKWSCTTKCV